MATYSRLALVGACCSVAMGCSLLVSTDDLAATSSARDAGTSETGDGKVFPEGAVIWSGNGHGYLIITKKGGFDWDEADADSRRRGGHLVTIQSAEENAFVFQLLGPAGPKSWLGGFQPEDAKEPDGGWSWVTGEPMTYTGWAAEQPNNKGGNEDAIRFESEGDGGWSDEDKGSSADAVVVEFE